MRFTALCVFGTLLALSSLPWTTANSGEGDLLGDNGFRPCAATLRPEGACRQGQDESTCPYLFSLPPLTVHLPKQLRELEKIMKDLQKLKDNVDQLRKMCADCTVSQSERECGSQREREHEKLNEGADTYGDEKNWMNERDPEKLKDYGTDRVKVEITMEGDGDTDTENSTTLEEKERNKWEAERESEKVIKENEKEDRLKEVADKDGKSQTEWTKGKDKLGQTKVPTSGGKERIVDMEREKGFESSNRDAHKNRNKAKDGKGFLMGEQEDTLDSEQERMMTTNMKNKEKIPENDHDVRQDETKETEKKTQNEEDRSSDGIKMSKEHDEHTNKVQEQHREERKEEMEKGIKAGQKNKKPKQTENSGRTEKKKTIKEVETEEVVDREMGREIKTKGTKKSAQSEQRDSDGESASSKATERTDFVSISPTPQSTIGLDGTYDSRDPHKAAIYKASPPPSPLSFVSQEAVITVNELTTQSNGEGGISEHTNRPTTTDTINTLGGLGHHITSATSSVISATRVRPRAGFQGSTTTPSYNSYTTTYSGVTDHSHWTAKKNSSNAKTGVKPLPGRGPQPDKKHKPGVKPEAEQRPKNPKNYRKPDQAPLPDKKPKHDQKLKPSHEKPTTDQEPKPGKDTKHVQMSKPDQRAQSDNVTTGQNLIPKHDQNHTTEENKLPNRKPHSHQKSMPPVQKPVTVNTTSPGKDPLTDQQPEYDDISIINRNSKPKMLHHTPKTNKPDQKQTPGRKMPSKETSKPDQRSELNLNFTHVRESERSEKTYLTTKHKPATELIRKHDENPSFEHKSNQDSAPGQKLTPRVIMPPDQKPKSSQTIPKNNQKPKPGHTPKFNHKHPVTVTDPTPKPNVKPKPGQTPQNTQRIKTPLSAQMPNLNPKSVPDEIPEAESSKTGKPRPPPRHRPPTRPVLKPGATPVQRPKPTVQPKPSPKTKADLDLPQISVHSTTLNSIQNSQTDLPPTSGAVKQTDDATHSPGDTEFSPSTAKTITLSAKTSNSLETRSFPYLHTLPESFTMNPNSRITSDLRPQAIGEPVSIPVTTKPNNIFHGRFPSVFSSTSSGSTKPHLAYNTDSSLQDTILHNVKKIAPRPSPDPDKMMIPVNSPTAQTTSTVSSDSRSTTSANSGPKLPDAEASTPSARELRVKINQVAALFNNSLSLNGKPLDRGPREHLDDKKGGSSPDKSDSKLPPLTSSKGKRYYFSLSCLVKFYLCVCVNTMYHTKHYWVSPLFTQPVNSTKHCINRLKLELAKEREII